MVSISRKGALSACGFLLAISAVLFFICRSLNSVEMLLLGRLIVGLAAGLVTATVPMYMAECAPLELRGTFAVLTSMGESQKSLFLNVGVFYSDGLLSNDERCFFSSLRYHYQDF